MYYIYKHPTSLFSRMSSTIFAPNNPSLPPVDIDSYSNMSSCAYSLDSLSNSQLRDTYENSDLQQNRNNCRKREMKNDSVRKSREKSKKVAEETKVQVEFLTIDNQVLSHEIHCMELELAKLKQAFQQQCTQESLAHSNLLSTAKTL